MTPLIVAILSLTILGIPFVLLIDRDAPPLRILGLGFLYGSGIAYLVLLAFAIVHVAWSLPFVVAVLLAIWIGAWVARRRGTAPPRTHSIAALAVDALTALTLIGFASYATLAPLWEWDFWAIWGLKARVFLEARTIDWRFLESRWNTFAHPDYPLLVPLNYDFATLLAGGWSDRWLGLIGVAWALALVLIVRELASRETPPLVAALITFAIASAAASHYVGLAEGALIAFGGAGVLFVRRAMLFDDDVAWRHAAICLGFAACCKNEGLAMLATAAVATLSIRRAARLWPAVAIAAPWLILRAIHTIPTDIAAGSVASRFAARVPHAIDIFRLLVRDLNEPFFWIAILVAVLLIPRSRERFVLLFTAMQTAIYAAAYFVTPWDPRWHIVTSWPRLTAQITVPITFATLVVLANSLRRAEDAPHAEARPQQ